MVHRREVNGEVMVFGNQGALWGNAMTWFDHATGSAWSQPLGQAVAGPLTGASLELYPSSLTTWGAWLETHPETLALETGNLRNSGFDIERMMVAVEIDDDIEAFPIPRLRETGPANAEVDGAPVLVLTDPTDPSRWSVFHRRVGNAVLTFSIVDGALIDDRTGTTWDPALGFGLEGPLADEQLAPIAAFTVFPRNYPTFWPDGRVWDG